MKNMDILYISPETRSELERYCERELIDNVFEDFSKYGKIVDKRAGQDPEELWIVTDYISSNTIGIRQKLAVILSFAALVKPNKEFKLCMAA